MKKRFFQLIRMIKQNPFVTALIIIAALAHLGVILPSGSSYCFNTICGDYFWGIQEHDGIWHIAVAESAFKTFPPRNPVFTGSLLSGYNILLDFVLFFFSKIGVSPFIMYFKILPVIWFIWFTYISLKLSSKWSKSKYFSFIFLFLNYFGASFSFLIPLFKERIITGSSSILSMQAVLSLTNVQLAYSYIFLLTIILILLERKLNNKNVFLLCILLFIQWGLKFYSGFASSVIVGVFLLERLIREKNIRYLAILLLASLSSIGSLFINYNPLGQIKSGPPFVFSPLSLVWPLIEDRGMLYSSYWTDAKYTFLASSRMSPRFIVLIGIVVSIYIFLNLGPRIIGLFYFIQKVIRKKTKQHEMSIFISIVLSLVIPLFFIQKGMWWNTVQFFFPMFILLNIYTAECIQGINTKSIKIILICTVIILSIPYATDALSRYFSYPGVIHVSDENKKALLYLKNLPDGSIYIPLYRVVINKEGNIPLFRHDDSAYIPAYTGKTAFFASETQLELLNVDYKGRMNAIKNGACNITTSIQYVYYHESQKDSFITNCIENNQKFKKIYSQDNFTIYSK